MGAVQDLVNEVLEEGAFDATSTAVLRWLSRRQRKMVARSRCYRTTRTLAVSGGSWLLGADVIEVLLLQAGGVPFTVGTDMDMVNAARGALVVDQDGIAVGTEGAGGARAVALWPAPPVGADVLAHVVLRAPDLDTANDATLVVPEDYWEALTSGAIATGLSRNPGDWRPDLAQGLEQAFTDGCEELRREVTRTLRGPGPAQIRVQGLNA